MMVAPRPSPATSRPSSRFVELKNRDDEASKCAECRPADRTVDGR